MRSLTSCPEARSHMFSYYGAPGTSAPTCQREKCDIPNPKYDRGRDPLRSDQRPSANDDSPADGAT